MSADLNTSIIIKGTPKQIFSMVQVIKEFSTTMYKQYQNNHDCAYIEFVNLHNAAGDMELEKGTEDVELISYLGTRRRKLEVSAMGPYGVFEDLSDVGLFEAIADAAPEAEFKGNCVGFVTGANVSLSAELKDGKLVLTNAVVPDECGPECYEEYVNSKLPYSKFCELFKVDQETFDDDSYSTFIEEAIGEEGFSDIDFDTFREYCENSELDEDEYDKVIGKIENLKIDDFETYMDEIFDDSNLGVKTVYDPITKTYQKG